MNTICAQTRCHQSINIPLDRKAEEQLGRDSENSVIQSYRKHHLVCHPQLEPEVVRRNLLQWPLTWGDRVDRRLAAGAQRSYKGDYIWQTKIQGVSVNRLRTATSQMAWATMCMQR